MATPTFSLPAGLSLSTEGGRLNLHFEGDLDLQSTLGLPIDRVEATGAVRVRVPVAGGTVVAGTHARFDGDCGSEVRCGGDLEVGGDLSGEAHAGGNARVRGVVAGALAASGAIELGALAGGSVRGEAQVIIQREAEGGDVVAGGALSVGGKVDAGALSGRDIRLGAHELKAKSIAATRSIEIGAAKLTVDVILAPEVNIAPAATGRVTVIESRNERPPTKIKGGFSLDDYEEMMGGALAFLEERGLSPLGDGPVPEGPAEEPSRLPEPEPDSDPDAWITGGAPTEEVEPAAQLEPTDDPISLNVDDIEMVEEADESRERLRDALRRLHDAYPGERPPFVATVEGWVAVADYTAISKSLGPLWNDVLDSHASSGTRPHQQVAHAFNLLHLIAQEAR